MKCWFLLVIVILALQPNEAQQPSNIFSFFFNNIFRRQSNRTRPSSSIRLTSTSGEEIGSSQSEADLFKTVTTTVTSTVESSTTVSEFFTVTETVTERLIATSTMTRKMTATATHIHTTCPDAGLRRINWKEIPNRIEEILKVPAGVEL